MITALEMTVVRNISWETIIINYFQITVGLITTNKGILNALNDVASLFNLGRRVQIRLSKSEIANRLTPFRAVYRVFSSR
jgi:hypothetical protein